MERYPTTKEHRVYVGGDGDYWDQIGRLQFDFVRSRGLEPSHILLDVGCGSLRAGIHFIPFLDTGHYLGIDSEAELIQRGIDLELGRELARSKLPEFVVSRAFEFDRFSRRPHVAIANSLFTHLVAADIGKCLRNLRDWSPATRFFATFFESPDEQRNPRESHPHRAFRYTRREMEAFGRSAGWAPEYIGEWGHPRDQVMMLYR